MSQPILIFDMDGVLVDVTESYRETIARTVEHFTGRRLAPVEIQAYKNQGGWNDDWKLSHHIVSTAGCAATFEEVKAHFQAIFHGNGTDGLILRGCSGWGSDSWNCSRSSPGGRSRKPN